MEDVILVMGVEMETVIDFINNLIKNINKLNIRSYEFIYIRQK